MKKGLILLFIASIFSLHSYSVHAAVIEPAPLPKAIANIPLREFIKLKPREMAAMAGEPLTVKNRIAFGLLKPSMKKAIRKSPNITTGEYFANGKRMKTWVKVLLIVLSALAVAFTIFALSYGAGSE